MQNTQPHSQRAIRLPELKYQTGLSRSTIYEKLNKKSPRYDSTFPIPKKLGLRSIGWIEAEVQAWIESRRATGA